MKARRREGAKENQLKTASFIGAVAILISIFCLVSGCDRVKAPETRGKHTVASLVPAATDLIMGMGAEDQLVAVSNYDRNRADVKSLPKVGDYLTTDWEQLAALEPEAMIVQLAPQRMPAGLKQRADELGIRLVNVHIDRVADVFTTLTSLGTVLHDPGKADRAAAELHRQLEAVRQRHAGRAAVRTLIVLDTDVQAVAGRNNFLNDLLEIAGGENVVPAEMGPWPTIDHEMLMKLDPEVILQLLPEASVAVTTEARRVWGRFPQLPAVASGRVRTLTQWYVLQPGWHIGQTAELFAEGLGFGKRDR